QGEVVPELETLVRQYPVRERLRVQLMLALYRSGRQADALAIYRDARRKLVDELGLEPSFELQNLEKQILTHDPTLEAPPRARLTRAPRAWLTRRRVAAVVTVSALTLALVLAFAEGREQKSVQLAPNHVGFIDARSGRVTASFAVGRDPEALAVA